MKYLIVSANIVTALYLEQSVIFFCKYFQSQLLIELLAFKLNHMYSWVKNLTTTIAFWRREFNY